MPIRAVILDYDGVVIDSAREGKKRILKIMRRRGYKLNGAMHKQMKNYWGASVRVFLKTCFNLDKKTAGRVNDEWEALDISDPPPLVEKALETLKWLNREGFRIAMLTSRRRQILECSLNYHALANFFYCIQSQDDWPFVKPDPRAFIYTLGRLKNLGISPRECIYIGDTPVDFAAANGAEIKNLSVLSGIFNEADFIKIGQKKENIIGSIANLPKWIKNNLDCS